MKKSVFNYILITVALFAGAWGLVEAGYYNPAQAMGRALAFFFVFNIFLVLRFGIRALKVSIYEREIKNPKYKESNEEI